MTDGALPLAGIRVLDMARVFAGPVAGRVLSDLGADVVKVEPPEGDVTRLWGRKTAGLSTYFTQQNCGKQNISIDLRAPGGPELVRELAAAADIVIENFRPGIMARYGIDWEALSTIKPSLIMLSISGFGQDSPESQRAAYAAIVHGEVGLVPVTGVDEPRDLSFSAGDVLSGMHGVVGLLAALRVRDQTGIGQHVDLAMMDAMAFSSDHIAASLDNRLPEPRGGEVYDAFGGPIMITGGLRWLWHTMSKTHGLIDPTPKDGPVEAKIESRHRVITGFLCGLPDRDSVYRALDDAGLAWGDIRELGEVLESPTIVHRNTVATIDDRDGGTRRIIRTPYRMSHSDTSDPGIAAFQGEHNHDVLATWLDKSLTDVDQLLDQGVLVQDEWAANTNK